MRSCINWRKGFKYLPQIDEFNIDFKEQKTRQLVSFLDKYAQTQRVNIKLGLNDLTKDNIDFLIGLVEEKDYFIAVCIDYYVNNDAELVKLTSQLREKDIPFYFTYAASHWDELYKIISFGVTDIFISGELGFELDAVRKVIPKVNIRCFANISQPEGLKGFFIRPEDVDIYDEYVDVIEFWNSEDTQSTLYEIYFKDREWNGDLREIIQGIKERVNNYYLLGSEFANRRIGCRKKCLKGERCALCDKLVDFAKTLEDSDEFEVYKI